MYTRKVKLKEYSYDIIIGNNILNLLGTYLARLSLGSFAYIITNASIKKLYGGLLKEALRKSGFPAKFRVIPDTEKSKSIKLSMQLVKELSLYEKKHKIFVIAFGGGVVGDLSGFVSSIYKRGISYIQIPTTLLAQVDSSIGGKTAVDTSLAKNLVGSFFQPRLVFCDIMFVKSLSLRQLRTGLAEVIKYGLIKDPELFSFLEKNLDDILSYNPNALEYIIKRSANIKASLVERDEKETRGLRIILNFGHTLGHAIEAAAGFSRYTHGEAIAIGMLIAARISVLLGLIGSPVYLRVENMIKRSGLPLCIRNVAEQDILQAYYHDKKFKGSVNRLVLLKGIGKTKIAENIPLGIIRKTVKERLE